MGRFKFDMSVDFMHSLGVLSEVEKFAPEMLNEALPILEREIKKRVKKHTKVGDLYASVTAEKAYIIKDGNYWYANVGFAGVSHTYIDTEGVRRTRGVPVRNMLKFALMEYGDSRQEATPFIESAMNSALPAVLDSMQATFNREALK